MFQRATSASLIGWPKRGRSATGCTSWGPVLPSGIPMAFFALMPIPERMGVSAVLAQPQASRPAASTQATVASGLADRIAHLPFVVHRPWLDGVVVLHEAHDRARLLQVRHARLHVAVVVHGAAHQHG